MTKPAPATAAKSSPHDAKRFARLAAVQALYQLTLTPTKASKLVKNFEPIIEEEKLDTPPAMDRTLFADIVTGVTDNTENLDGMIAGVLDAKRAPERLEMLLSLILRAGAFELHHHGKIPASVIINDYVDVTHAFFNDREPGLVNAMLDKLAKNLR